MTWRETISAGTASFRGVGFSTVEAEARVGRRNATHEFPQRDQAWVEDLGRGTRQFVVEGYVIGDDYLTQRDALIDALEAEGPGELIHPRYGVVDASVVGMATVRESPREGGIARFSITFVPAGANRLPVATDNTSDVAVSSAEGLDDAASNAYGSEADYTGPMVLANDATTSFGAQLSSLVDMARRGILPAEVGAVMRQINTVSNGLSTLLRTPLVLAQQLTSLQLQLAAEIARPQRALIDLKNRFNAQAPRVATSGGTQGRRIINDNAQRGLERRMSLSQQARMISLAMGGDTVEPFVTAQQAQAARDQVLAQIDTELETADPPAAVVRALTQLGAAVVRDVSARAEYLRERSTFTTQATLPALFIAHRVYQDASRADELVERNSVRHPAFVPAGALEILR